MRKGSLFAFAKFSYNVLEFGKVSYIKRVIGIEGDHIKIENGKVYLNGEELDEPYLREGIKTESRTLADFTVPEGYIFAMGDNREHSTDCRDFGCIPLEKVEGRQPILPIKKGSYDKFIRIIRHKLSALGLNETLSYTLIPNSEVHKYTLDTFTEINLLDPMSDDRRTLRYSLIPSLMSIYDYNLKRNNKDIFIYEIGKGFAKIDNNYQEHYRLAVLLSGNFGDSRYPEKVSFYHLKGILESLLDDLGFYNRYSLKVEDLPKEFHPGSSAKVILNGMGVGYIGKVHPNECKNDVYVLELNLDMIRAIKTGKETYKEISKYPNIVKDVAFIIDKNIKCEDLMKEIKKYGGKYLVNIELFDYYKGDNIGEDKCSLAFNLVFNNPQETLTEEIVMPLFEKIIEGVTKKFNCEVRDK